VGAEEVTAQYEQTSTDHSESAWVEDAMTVALNSAASDAGAHASDRVLGMDGVHVSEQVDDLQGVLDAGTSIVPEAALVGTPASSLLPSGHLECLVDEVVEELDATRRVAELSAAWVSFSISFGEKLQVRVLYVAFLLDFVLIFLFSSFPFI
jgi:hypothetical protein